MSSGRGGIAAVGVALLGVGAAAGVLHAREARYPVEARDERLLYLRSPAVADRVALTFDAVAADVYWIRAIQHFGRDAHRLNLRANRGTPAGTFDPARDFVLLQPLLDMTTTLDPQFNIAYRFGAIFLAAEPPFGPGRADQALALLERGLAQNPTRWQYAFDIGFLHYWSRHDAEAAAQAFERAAAIPGAPNWLEPLIVASRLETGDRATARKLLALMKDSEAEYIRRAADRGLAQLDAMDLIDRVNAIVETYARGHGSYPAGWQDLQRERLLGQIPVDSAGTPLVYDPATHTASLSPQSPLAPLPTGLKPVRRPS